MKLSLVLTDLDGTLLEPDGSVTADALAALGTLRQAGVPVCPVTSKTAAELGLLSPRLGLADPAGFENGAGIWWPGGRTELQPAAIPLGALTAAAFDLRGSTGIAFRTLVELSDEELAALTGLKGAALAAARSRAATLPLVVAAEHDQVLRDALPGGSGLRLIRGNRFLHLQGPHDKADLVPRLAEAAGAGDGLSVACGDAPNDTGLLAAAPLRVIVPSAAGPHPALLSRFPDATVAPLPHGRGWAAALLELVGAA